MLYTPVDGDEGFFLRVMASYSDGQGSDRKSAEAVSDNRVQAAPFTNTAPVFPSSEDGRREVEENTPTRRDIGVAVAAVDPDMANPDVDETLTYRLEGNDAAAFEIDELSGQLRTGAALDFEGKRSYSMRLTVTDTSGEFDRITVRVAVLNVDEPPVLSGPAEVDYAENSRGLVGEFSAVDPEKARIVWTLVGDDADVLEISSGGVLTFGSPPDYETPTDVGGDNTYVVTVEASDGTYTPSPSRRVTVRVSNVEEDGSVTLTPARPEVGVEISADLEDPDGGISNRVWRWERSPNNRDWTPIPGAGGDSYTPTSADRGHYLQVVVTYDDAEGPTKVAAAATTSRVPNPTRPPPPPPSPSPSPPSPPPGPSSGPGPGPSGGGGPEPLPPGANHPPEFGEGSRTVRTVAENNPAGTDIGAPVTATDPEGDLLAYKLAGTAAGTFDLDSATGQLKTRAALDYETRNSYTVSVEVRDGKNPEGEPDRRRDDSIRVTINIVNRNDPGWVTLSAPTPRVDQPLQAALSDPDGDIADLNWRWERSTDQNTWTPIPDATTNTYTPTPGDEGHYLRVTATYGDPFGPGQAATDRTPQPGDGRTRDRLHRRRPTRSPRPRYQRSSHRRPVRRYRMRRWAVLSRPAHPTIDHGHLAHPHPRRRPPHRGGIPLRRHRPRAVVDPLRRGARRPQHHPRMCHQPTPILPRPLRHPRPDGQLPGPSPPTTRSPNPRRVHRHRRKHPPSQHRRPRRRRNHPRMRHRPPPLLPRPTRHPRPDGHLPASPRPHPPKPVLLETTDDGSWPPSLLVGCVHWFEESGG